MRFFSFLTVLMIFNQASASGQTPSKPKLVVNIVVSQMRYDDLQRFASNFTEDGFRRFMREGIQFTDSKYGYTQTNTVAGLATLTTGANPSIHGVVGERWVDQINNNTVNLIQDNSVRGLDCDAGIGAYSNANLTTSTVGDRLKAESPASKIISLAISPASAVVMGGFHSSVYWMDDSRGSWISSSAYAQELPEWVKRYNNMRTATSYLDYTWIPLKNKSSYKNNEVTIIDMDGRKRLSLDFLKNRYLVKDYHKIPYTPAANSLTAEFAKQAIIYEELGKDDNTDLLNVCFDTPRLVGELFGPESTEVEDMYYRLDKDLGDLLTFITAQVAAKDVVIVLTADHGASNSYNHFDKPIERFSVTQFKMIINAFMNAQYGSGDWVTDFVDRQLFLNRPLMYAKNINIAEVQNRVAAFALQFRGVSHAMTSTAMQTSFFGGGYGNLMQNGYYPRRSGDVTVNLLPGWIEESAEKRSLSGSMYDYDRRVPLMWLGSGIMQQQIRAPVDMTSVAPTLAYIMQIGKPEGCAAAELDPIAYYFR